MTDLSTDITSTPPEQAKLRVYIGAAPGVGKTYQMLEDAHLMKKQGVDVVIGLIEPHGRKDTQDQVRISRSFHGGLSLTARWSWRKWISMPFLPGIPKPAMVDELAHTNVPGSRNRKRYEDVLEFLTRASTS